jgi:dethiobiotin synthetase
VPLNESQTGADLASALQLPIVLVVGLRLGCLNHALLTQEAILSRGLQIAGWVANRIDPQMPAQEDNIAFLSERLKAPLWADVPRMAQPLPSSVQWLR